MTNTETVPALASDYCAYDEDHTLPAEVIIYGNIPVGVPRAGIPVVCNDNCADLLTDQYTSNM